MFITLYGPDTYRRQKRTEELITRYRRKFNGLSIKSFDFLDPSEDLSSDLVNYLQTQSLFESVRLALIKNISLTDLASLSKTLSSIATTQNTVLILSLDKKPQAAKLSFLFNRPNTSEFFPELSLTDLKKYLLDQCTVLNLKLSPNIISLLVNTIGSDLWRLNQELTKLAHIKSTPLNLSTLSTLNLTKNYTFFDCLRALSGQELTKRLTSLQILFHQAEDPAKIFNLLAYQKNQSPGFFSDLDLDIKSGRLEYESALLYFALK